MEEKDLDFFKDFLNRWLDELLNHPGDNIQSLLDSHENLPDPLDRASAELDKNWTLRIRDRNIMLIKKIRNSLEAIETEEYGICEDCGEDISIQRLRARPVTSFCIECKTKRESIELLTGS